VHTVLVLICLVWLVPTIGLLVSSFRTPDDIQTTGWWTVFPHPGQVKIAEIPIPEGLDKDGVMTIEGATGTFEEFRAGITAPDGRQIVWVGNKRAGRIEIRGQQITANANFTLDNYGYVLTGKDYQMLELLSLRKGTTLTKEMFLNHLYGGMDEPELKIIDVFICKLRKKLAEATGGHNYIETVWGRGYVLREPTANEKTAPRLAASA
jgi:two-component system cell cycle response regulator CtrA